MSGVDAAEVGLSAGETFFADAKVVSEGTVWVHLIDGRGWLFIERAGEVVLERIDPGEVAPSATNDREGGAPSAYEILNQVKSEVREAKSSFLQGPTLLSDTASPRSLDRRNGTVIREMKPPGFLQGPTLLADTASPRSLDRRKAEAKGTGR